MPKPNQHDLWGHFTKDAEAALSTVQLPTRLTPQNFMERVREMEEGMVDINLIEAYTLIR